MIFSSLLLLHPLKEKQGGHTLLQAGASLFMVNDLWF